MRVLLIGSGGREHALGWKLASSPRVTELMSLPGNPGLAALGPIVEGIESDDVGAIAAMARIQAVDLVVVGPEVPLAAGVADAVGRLGIPVFGPTRAAARLESSKSFAKEVMARAGVATAGHARFTNPEDAKGHLERAEPPHVVKADGLAGGKGVLVTDSMDDAMAWVDRWVDAGPMVIEEYLDGPEVSVFAVCTEKGAMPLAPARDYKNLLTSDEGPNTGGMGAYSPVDLPEGLVETVMDSVIRPTLAQMSSEGTPYSGFLYAGISLTSDGPKVLEFNVRLGDPETQALLPLLTADLVDVLEGGTPTWSNAVSLALVVAAGGYPESPAIGATIHGINRVPSDVMVFHAGTRSEGASLKVAGGRVLNLVVEAATIADARTRVYDAVQAVRFEGMQYRTDIGL